MMPYNHYKHVKLQWLTQIPEHWETKRVAILFDERKTHNKNYEIKTAFKFKFGDIVEKKQLGTEEELKETYEKYTLIDKDDIVINGLNLNYDFLTQRVGLVNRKGIITSAYISMTPRKSVNPKYACYTFKSMDNMKMLNGFGTGIRLTLSFSELKKQYLPVPPIEEQNQIVKFLDYKISKINKFIKDKKREIELLKETKQAEINHAVTKGINPDALMKHTGIEKLGKIPEHWEVRRLKYAVSFNPSIEMEIQDETPVSFMPMECLRNASIEKRESSFKLVKGYVPFKNDDVVMAKVTPCFENGNIAVAEDLINGVGFGTSEIFVFRCKEILLNTYLLYFLQTGYFKNKGIASMTGTGGLKRVSPKVVQNIPFPLPHINEQSTIVKSLNNKCNTIEKLIGSIQNEIDKIQEYKTSLISEVVTGKVDVRDVKVSEDFESVTMEEAEAETEEVIEE
ncbi:MAG: restriction endonuclease subunit S [Bacteroidales bacterium]|nr:restriction endonuclease subunit S [Bacteroidales bacterium]